MTRWKSRWAAAHGRVPLAVRRAERPILVLLLTLVPQQAPATASPGSAAEPAPGADCPVSAPEAESESRPAGPRVEGQVFKAPRTTEGQEAMGGTVAIVLGRIERTPLDLVILIDTSDSTRTETGADINGNGVVGETIGKFDWATMLMVNTDPGDSILAAQVMAARRVLDELEPSSTRVWLISFAGSPPPLAKPFGHPTSRLARHFRPKALDRIATVEEPLTNDYGRVEIALTRLLERGAMGLTDIAAGIEQAMVELQGMGSRPREHARVEKRALLLTDGVPSLPYLEENEKNVELALRAADRARRAGIGIDIFAIGTDALMEQHPPSEAGRLPDGSFTRVANPVCLPEALMSVLPARVDQVEIVEGNSSRTAVVEEDGSFAGLVRIPPTAEHTTVRLQLWGGRTLSTEIAVTTPLPGLPASLQPSHTRALDRLDRETAEAIR